MSATTDKSPSEVAAERKAKAYAEARKETPTAKTPRKPAAKKAPAKPKAPAKAAPKATKTKSTTRRRTFKSEAGRNNDSFREGGPSFRAMATTLRAAEKAAKGKGRKDPAVAARDEAIFLARQEGWSFNDLSDAMGRNDNGTFAFRRLAQHNARVSS